MIIGILKEVKAEENRVAMTPAGAELLAQHKHRVLLERDAGKSSGFDDAAYIAHSAEIITSAEKIFQQADMIMRVKEPQEAEYELLRPGQVYFSYLHLAASEQATQALIKSGAVCIAYETIQKPNGSLPLLIPMSEVAGQMAIQEGAKYLEMAQGGDGVLLGGVPGVNPGVVVILGGGVVGINAAKRAAGLGANVYIVEIDLDRLRYLSDVMPQNCFLLMSSPATIRDLLSQADVVVGAAAFAPGSKAPVLVTREMLKTMKRGAVLIDVSIDQGGCFESSRETTHAKPTYTLDGIVHYAVSNMPGAVPKTSTMALTNASLPYVSEIADKGWQKAMCENQEIACGANVVQGKITYKAVADAFGLEHTPIQHLL